MTRKIGEVVRRKQNEYDMGQTKINKEEKQVSKEKWLPIGQNKKELGNFYKNKLIKFNNILFKKQTQML